MIFHSKWRELESYWQMIDVYKCIWNSNSFMESGPQICIVDCVYVSWVENLVIRQETWCIRNTCHFMVNNFRTYYIKSETSASICREINRKLNAMAKNYSLIWNLLEANADEKGHSLRGPKSGKEVFPTVTFHAYNRR